MNHSFNVEIATEYGLEESIILENLLFWIKKNHANGKHIYDGNCWTYNSVRAFNELFPYISESTIRRTLKNLETEGLIITGNYNKVTYDRTMWYAITEKGFCKLNTSICQIDKMDSLKNENRNSQNEGTIPDINTDNKTDINNTGGEKPKKARNAPFQKPTLEEVKAYCQERKNSVDPEKWYAYYESNGWMVGRNKMKYWKAAVITWERNTFSQNSSSSKKYSSARGSFADEIPNCGKEVPDAPPF